jgi:hypothetical protein
LHQLSDANKANKHELHHEVIVVVGDEATMRAELEELEELEGLGKR